MEVLDIVKYHDQQKGGGGGILSNQSKSAGYPKQFLFMDAIGIKFNMQYLGKNVFTIGDSALKQYLYCQQSI